MQGRLCSCRGKLVRVRCERGSPEKTRNCELVVIPRRVKSFLLVCISWNVCLNDAMKHASTQPRVELKYSRKVLYLRSI